MDLSALIKKTGHHLAEIRQRAFRNIICKLDHALLSVPDLVQEKTLLVNLLEWFNFPEVPMQGEVLQLLSTLAKHPAAAQILRDVGAVEFLTQLSPKVESHLRTAIDSIFDQLFRLPEVPLDFAARDQQLDSANSGAFVHLHEDDSLVIGYFQNNSSKAGPSDSVLQRVPVDNSVKCLKFSTFPWLTLTTTDRHILASNESSLRNSNSSLVRTTCELLQDVIMQDFPAEIFLQRPGIVQNLLSLMKLTLTSGDGGDVGDPRLWAAACLRQLCANLRCRLRFHRDPDFHSLKQETVSQNSSMSYSQDTRGPHHSALSSPEECSPRPSVVGRPGQRARGDGQDGDMASSSSSSSSSSSCRGATSRPPLQPPAEPAHLEPPETEAEDAAELQLRQLSLAQLGTAIVEHALPLLKMESTKVLLCVLELLSEAALLLRDAVSDTVWEDSSLIGLELKEKLLGSLDCLGDVLHHHCASSSDVSEPLLAHHRMAYVGTAIFTLRFLQTLLPVEKACEVLPDSTGAAIFILCLDSPFSLSFPCIHESAVAYLEQVSPENYQVYRRATQAAQFMESTCSFLKEVHAQGDRNWMELLELADQAVNGFPYHKHLPVVKECVQICSDLSKSAQSSPLLLSESQNVFLRLLSHPLMFVKAEAYRCTLNIVKDCLGVQNATKPVSSVCHGVNFLLHARVLYEICTFGLQDQAEMVSSSTREILLFLLKGQLMMTAATWHKFIEALCPVVPVLQGYADTKDALGNCILLISGPANETTSDALPSAARTRAAVRLLFARQRTVRDTAVQHLMPHLSNAEGNCPRPVLERTVLTALPSLYLRNKEIDLTLNDSEKSFLKVESVNKLYGILASETVDLVLRKSAAEQLAVVLQDTAMHPVLKNLGMTEKVISFIDDSVNRKMKSMDCLLEASFCLLRKLVYADQTLRCSLAQRPTLLITLLRASMIIKENKGDVTEASALMCLLLFDEIARLDLWTDNTESFLPSPFSLPLSVTKRYNFPFQPTSHHAVSPYCPVLPLYSDLIALRPAWEMLQLAWNRAWHGGMDNLLEQVQGHCSDVPEFLDELSLSAAQAVLLRVTHVPSGLQDCVSHIQDASSHSAVVSALAKMRFYLLVDQLALKSGASGSRAILRSLRWHAVIERFLQVQPACPEDEKLLLDIMVFLRLFFKPQMLEPENNDLRWILELLLKQETGSLLNLLIRADSPVRSEAGDTKTHVSQRLQKELTGFLSTLLHCLVRTSDRACLALAGAVETQLAACLLQCLRVSDAPHFYGLPSLGRTLRCMACIGALPGWSTHSHAVEPQALCLKYLSGLLEVISSFYIEWGGNSMSFMGKGVTKSAVMCLLHLSHEMMAECKDMEWMELWSLPNEPPQEQSVHPLGLTWLIPLWVDRDPEVRFASLAIGSALTATERGCLALASSCQNISGGLWGTLLNTLLDQQECSMARREATFILQNLLVLPMPANMDEAKDFAWQGPCVHDEGSGLALVGLPALQALLYHCQFFEQVSQMVKCCYLGRYSFDLDFPRIPSPKESNMDERDDPLRRWRAPSGPLNRSHVSGSQSTSSTLILPEGVSEARALMSSSSRNPLADTLANRLVAQGQSDTDSSDSVLSHESRPGEAQADQRAIVTTHLVSALCGLLNNLLAMLPDFTLGAMGHQGILSSLASLVNAATIDQCLCELRGSALPLGAVEDAKSQVQTLLEFLSSFSKLLHSCVILKPDLVSEMEFTKTLLSNIFTVISLDVRHIDSGTSGAVLHTWADLFTLLATMLKKTGAATFPSVSAALARRWRPFTGTFSLCVQLSHSEPALYSAAMRFLSAVLTEEGRRRMRVEPGLHPAPGLALSQLLSDTPGRQLCEVLLQCYDKRSFQDPLKRVTFSALVSLLTSSASAQSHACKAGLVDVCVEQLKNIYTQLHKESLRAGKGTQRKKDDLCVKQMKMVFQVLRNCLYNNGECKAAASDACLASAVHALWPWLLLDDSAMEAALELLCVYTANCASACSALCGSGVGPAHLQRGPGGGSSGGSSLMQAIMRLAAHVAPDNSSLQRLAFSLLANLAVSRDCKGVFQKNNFLQLFPSLSLPKVGGKSASPAAGLWLKLLLNMSFSEEGQHMILKLEASLELLAELAQSRRNPCQPAALLILHNICFCSANKPKVLACGKALRVLVSCLESSQLDVRTIGASALWALLHNYQKAKVTLKNPCVKARVEEALSSAREDAGKTKDEPMKSYLMKCLENLSHLLNT